MERPASDADEIGSGEAEAGRSLGISGEPVHGNQ